MRKASIQIKVGLLLIAAVIFISATCYLSYRNLSSKVSSISTEFDPELRLENIQSLSSDLENAENSIRLFSVTRDTSDLIPYYSIINGIDNRIKLVKSTFSFDSVMVFQIDTISTLIGENIANWNRMLYLAGSTNVIRFLNQLSDKVNQTSQANENKSILKRVFSRNTKPEKDKELLNSIRQAEEEVRKARENQKGDETKLAVTNTILHDKIFELIARMDAQAEKHIIERGVAANELARSTNAWILLFSVTGGLLAIIVLYLIIRYLRHTQAYQVALERSKLEAESLARTKELFLANISHEIRTPVTAISGFTEQLLHDAENENVLRSLRIIKSSSDHLARIIDDILDLARLQNGKLVLEPAHFSISQIMNEINIIFEPLAARNKTLLRCIISPGTPPFLFGDPYRLKQILNNLVGNAIKFTEEGRVEVIAEAIRKDDNLVDLVLKINDTGIGIEENKLSMIFDDFTQAEVSTARKYGGAGLGLSIVRKLIDLHGGSITCESKKNIGTRITCLIPFRIGDEKKVKKDYSLTLAIPDEIKDLKVLIVDDEEFNRLLFRKILERWKINSDEVDNGVAALEILKEKRYDLVLMDIRMSGIDGLKVTQFIREELGISSAEMQIICVSALSIRDAWPKYRKAGMNEFLQKPFTEEMLLTTILSARGMSRSEITVIKERNEPELPDEAAKINLASLFHISGGDNHFVRQMLTSFNHSTKKSLYELKDAVKSGHSESIANLAHKMLPPCRHIGAKELCSLLEKIETGAQAQIEKTELENLAGRLITEFELVCNLLEKEISTLN